MSAHLTPSTQEPAPEAGNPHPPTDDAAGVAEIEDAAAPSDIRDAIRDLAAVDAARALDHFPALIAGSMYDELAELVAQCKLQNAQVDSALLSALTRTLQTVARRADAERRHEDASRYWAAALDIDPENALSIGGLRSNVASLTGQARAANRLGDEQEAARLLARVGALDRYVARSFESFRSALDNLGRLRQVAESALTAGLLGEACDRRAAALRLAEVARRLGSPEEQLAVMIKARELDPAGAQIRDWGDRAAASILKTARKKIDANGDLGAAVGHLIAVRQWDDRRPDVSSTQNTLIAALRAAMQNAKTRGDADEMVTYARLILDLDKDHVPAMKLVSRRAYDDRSFHVAAALYSRLIELDPKDERHYLRLGRIYRTLRIFGKGKSVITRLLEINPDHPEAKQLLVEMT